jgi:hypothetical protein
MEPADYKRVIGDPKFIGFELSRNWAASSVRIS